jgi:hypothetical protein
VTAGGCVCFTDVGDNVGDDVGEGVGDGVPAGSDCDRIVDVGVGDDVGEGVGKLDEVWTTPSAEHLQFPSPSHTCRLSVNFSGGVRSGASGDDCTTAVGAVAAVAAVVVDVAALHSKPSAEHGVLAGAFDVEHTFSTHDTCLQLSDGGVHVSPPHGSWPRPNQKNANNKSFRLIRGPFRAI